jgi:hypothetical protein
MTESIAVTFQSGKCQVDFANDHKIDRLTQ